MEHQVKDDCEIALDDLGNLYLVPNNFELVLSHLVHLDRRPLWWLRFERVDKVNGGPGGEHIAVLIDTYNHRLMGLTHLDSRLAQSESPDAQSSEKMAREFVERHAPDIAGNLVTKWIQPLSEKAVNPPHDSALGYREASQNERRVLLGTRVKMVDESTGLYSWLVVTSGGDVLNFERDIHWSTLRGRRTSEVWLHDAYPAHPGRKQLATDAARLMSKLRG